MKIITYSDGHGILPTIPPCDVFIHAGDICPNFSKDRYMDIEFQRNWVLNNLNPWLLNLKAKRVILVPGNHDSFFQEYQTDIDKILESRGGKIECLIDRGISINDVSFYGTPWVTPVGVKVGNSSHWAFAAKGEDMQFHRNSIPYETDVLITHGPPEDILDYDDYGSYGDPYLKKWINKNWVNRKKNNLKYNIFGHVHAFGGEAKIIAGVAYINSAKTILEFTYEQRVLGSN